MASILAFSGSVRADSLNSRALTLAVAGSIAAGARVTHVNLADYSMPIYQGDEEAAQGIPPAARALKELLKSHDALLIASPEYNSGYSALLKNTLDWCSRPHPGESSSPTFRGKPVGLLAASPGALGGLRGLYALRSVLLNIGMVLYPELLTVPKATEVLADPTNIDATTRAKCENFGRQFALFSSKFAS